MTTEQKQTKPYREGQDETELPNQQAPKQEEASGRFVTTDGDIVNAKVVTAVLLVELEDGRVLPITNIANLEMQKEASLHHILRMCADVQDQISTVRGLGEDLQAVRKMIDASSIRLFEALTGRKAPTQWAAFINGTQQAQAQAQAQAQQKQTEQK